MRRSFSRAWLGLAWVKRLDEAIANSILRRRSSSRIGRSIKNSYRADGYVQPNAPTWTPFPKPQSPRGADFSQETGQKLECLRVLSRRFGGLDNEYACDHSVFMEGAGEIHYPSVVSTRAETPERETFRKLGSTGYFTLNTWETHMQGSSYQAADAFRRATRRAALPSERNWTSTQ